MDNSLPKEELEELKQLCEKATPGPWTIRWNGGCQCDYACTCPRWPMVAYSESHTVTRFPGSPMEGRKPAEVVNFNEATDCRNEDAEFIIAARTALPKLIEEVEELRKDKARLDWIEAQGYERLWETGTHAATREFSLYTSGPLNGSGWRSARAAIDGIMLTSGGSNAQ